MKPPESIVVEVEVEDEDELQALTELVLALRELNRPGRMAELQRRMRLAYYQGAEDQSREALGRPLTQHE